MKDSLSRLRARAHASLLAGNPERALRAVSRYVDMVRINEMCTGRVLSSLELDNICAKAGDVIRTHAELPIVRFTPTERSKWLHVVSRLQTSGGHTRLLRNVIQAYPEKEHIVVATNIDRQSERQAVTALLNGRSNVRFISIKPCCGFERKVRLLMSYVVNTNPEKAFLFCHHQDAVAVAAMANAFVEQCYFVHHADHHLCLGVHIGSFSHIDLNRACYNSCTTRLSSKHIYLPLTAEAPPVSSRPNHSTDGLTTCTAARSNKIKPAYHTDYCEVIPEILHRTQGTHVHIGHLSLATREKIFAGMRKRNIDTSRFVYIPFVDNLSEALLSKKVDLYIGSFPYAGALTMVEVMATGLPIAVHRNAISDLLGCREMAYPEAFEWSCAEELYAYCTSITPAQLAESGERARAHYEAFHRPSEIRKVLERNHSLVASQVPKKEKNTSDGSIEAEEICAQAGLYHLFMARLRWSIVQVYAFLSRNLSRCVR